VGVVSTFPTFAATLDYPMFVVTTTDGTERAGCLVGFGTQCSIDPPRFVVFLSEKNRTERVAQHAEVLVVHPLDETHRELAELFGGETGDEVDKFASVAWQPGPGGVPVLDDCPRWFAGRIRQRIEAGDHVGYLLDVLEADVDRSQRDPDADELMFQDVRSIEPGHEP
jgi:flavin reductase (DIM6/NTAB) family NADH-FMN oxidoreductase RutF